MVDPADPRSTVRLPPRLAPLIEDGVIDRVIRPLLSGKEAQVYLVGRDDLLLAAKVYKGSNRSFRNRSQYTEGRKVRNSRDQRAMKKRSRYGKERDQETWNSAEADTIYKLFRDGVRVPKPYDFVDGVLVMECVAGLDGGPAPRIADCDFNDEEALDVFNKIIAQVVRMLCSDVVHADLSIYNVLMSEEPVIIDFPQSIGASSNMHARNILLRDVANIASCFRLGRPNEELRHGYEMWDLFQAGELTPETVLSGAFELDESEIDEEALIMEMREIEEDEAVADYDD